MIFSYSMRRMELRAPVIIIWPFLATVKVEHRKSHLPHLFSFSLLWYDTYLPPAPQRSGVENKIGINSKYAIQCKYTIVERVGGVALVLLYLPLFDVLFVGTRKCVPVRTFLLFLAHEFLRRG